MMKNKLLILCCIFYLDFHATQAFSADKPEKDTTLYFDLGEQGGWVPYRSGIEDGAPSVFSDLTQHIQTISNIQFVAVHLPQRRANRALQEGTVDFDFTCPEWFEGLDTGAEFVITEPLFEITEHLVTLKINTHLFSSRESIFGKRVGTIAGYEYRDDQHFIRTDFLDENSLILGLKRDRFKVAILERETAKFWARKNQTDIGFVAQHTSGKLVIRLRKEHSHLLPLINQSIKKLKTSGQLQNILNTHGVDSKIY